MIKTAEQIKMIKVAGKILANVAGKIKDLAKEGISLKELDKFTKKLIQALLNIPV